MTDFEAKQRNTKAKGRSLKGDGETFNLLAQPIPYMRFRFPNNQIHSFVQSITKAGTTSSNVAMTNATNYFSASDIAQISSFSTVFDQYRIVKIEVWITPRNPTSTTGAAINRGRLLSVIDYDDATALTTESDYQQYSNCVMSSAVQGHYRAFVPHCAVAAYSGAFTSYANVQSPWIDLASTTVQHYGLKYGITQADSAADVVVYDLLTRLHFQFKNVR
jgi:hypothetical protein